MLGEQSVARVAPVTPAGSVPPVEDQGAPSAEVHIDADVLRALLVAQRPDLAHLECRVVAQGWDNVLVRVGADLVARLPRREVAVVLIQQEARWLPALASHLPVAIPVPVFLGRPGAGYPWPWAIYPWITGGRATDGGRPGRADWAPHLARVFHALHVPAPADAPHNPVRAVPLATREEIAAYRLRHLHRLAGADKDLELDLGPLTETWHRGLVAPAWAGPPLWVHGDPHPGNLLIADGDAARSQSLTALLDFGDLTAGDPACDLATAWLTFDAAGREAFRTTYDALAAPDPGRWDRAAAWAVLMACSVVAGAPGDHDNRPWALQALRELAAG